MGVVPVLDPRPGELILDLAAAPGGKSTYVADRLQGSGLLWSHDVDASRVGTLVGNLERWGAANVVVSHGPVARLAPLYGTFDRVLLDAPCSGEGMFRKSRAALDLWSPGRVAEFVAVQARLLDEAVELLKPGGVLVYATCTFGADEDEAAIDALLGRRDDVAPQTITVPGASGGLASYAGVAGLLSSVARWWPQRQPGEGHFVACLRKTTDHGSAAAPERARSAMLPGAEPSRPELAALEAFQSDVLGGAPVTTGPVRRFGDWLHALPAVDLPRALGQGGLAPRRVGLPLGRLAHGRFEPHHALSHALPSRGDAGARLDLDAHDPRVSAYLRGEVIAAEADAVVDGWLVVRASGLPLGWARAKRGELNNHYPKGLRRG
jgi:NOL1/NOP2/fmu family ribosome biogenesis protein